MTIAVAKDDDQEHAITYVWADIDTADDTGDPVEIPDHADKSVQHGAAVAALVLI